MGENQSVQILATVLTAIEFGFDAALDSRLAWTPERRCPMPAERLSMRRLREILRLNARGHSGREIDVLQVRSGEKRVKNLSPGQRPLRNGPFKGPS